MWSDSQYSMLSMAGTDGRLAVHHVIVGFERNAAERDPCVVVDRRLVHFYTARLMFGGETALASIPPPPPHLSMQTDPYRQSRAL